MPIILKAACWASAIIVLAIASILGFVADNVATALFVILPLVAVLSLNGRGGCARCAVRGA